MSGYLRQQIGLASTLLAKQVEAAKKAKSFVREEGKSDEESLLSASAVALMITKHVNAVTRTKDRLSGLIAEWNRLLADIDPEDYEEEQKRFEDANTNNGFLTNELNGEVELSELTEKLELTKLAEKFLYDRLHPTQPTQVLSTHRPSIRLPKLEATKFNGDPKNWPRFWEFFESTIHNSSLSEVEKLTYLIGLLEGDAKTLASGYNLTAANYATIVNQLKQKFGQTSRIVDSLLRNLNDLPKLDAKGNVASLKSFVVAFERLVRQLRLNGVNLPVEQLQLIVETKWSWRMAEKLIERKHTQNNWNYETLIQVMNGIANDMEELDRKSRDYVTNPKATRTLVVSKVMERNKSSLQKEIRTNPPQIRVVSDNRQQTGQPRPCLFCDRSGHRSFECKAYQSPQQRRERLKTLKRCFRCIKPLVMTHQASKCQATCYHCKGTHHSLLCPREGQENPRRSTTLATTVIPCSEGEEEPEEVNTQTFMSQTSQALLPSVEVIVFNSNTKQERKVWALLDSASDTSYVTTKFAESMKLPMGPERRMRAEVFGSGLPQPITSHEAEIGIKLPQGTSYLMNLWTIPLITNSIQVVTKTHGKLDCRKEEPQILIGVNYLFALLGWQRDGSDWTELKTRFGPIIIGKPPLPEEFSRVMMAITKTDTKAQNEVRPLPRENEVDAQLLTTYWNLETLGIREETDFTINEQIEAEFLSTLKREDEGRYSVNWLKKDNFDQLPSNINIAFWRLKSNLKTLQKNPEFLAKYKQVFDDQLANGIIEKVTNKTPHSVIMSYLPHQPVVTPDKATTKLRVVYDGSAKRKTGFSVNDVMYDGPVLLPDMLGVIWRFRLGNYAASSDLEKAFLQIALNEDQRDVVRFLLPKNWNQEVSAENVQVYRFKRLPFGINCSPSILAMVLRHHLSKNVDTEDIVANLYVDNLIQTSDVEEELTQEVDRAKRLFSEAAFNLREIYSNSEAIMEKWSPTAEKTTKIFGLTWDYQSDNIEFKWKPEERNQPPTKRSILRYVASIYDPMGLLAPSLLEMKLLLQEIWTREIGWDDPLPSELEVKWGNIMKVWNEYPPTFKQARQLARKIDDLTLHIFVDASVKAYGGVAYIVSPDFGAQLIFSRSRLTPPDHTKKQTLTIPRKELIAILCGTRMAKKLQKEVPNINQTIIWSDSQIVLNQIKGKDEGSVFVKNRISEIRKSRNLIEFRYVPTKDNPADLTSRGVSLATLMKTANWWKGPSYLTMPKSTWPSDIIIERKKEIFHEDEQEEEVRIFHAQLQAEESPISPQIGNWKKILNTTNWVIKFANKIRRLEEFKEEPEMLIWKLELRRFPPSQQKISKYRLFQDDLQVWRVNTRLQESELDSSTIYPIWLPADSPMTSKLIQHYHEQHQHFADKTVITSLRQKYWITSSRVKYSTRKCQQCKPFTAIPFTMPIFAPLPKSRVIIGKPFEVVGLDTMGPLKTTDATIHVLLITCLKTRAVHLELVESTKTQDILDSLQKFIAKRGMPAEWLSDNATSFVLASKVLIQRYPEMKIRWTFITPRAPWKGGAWERLNHSIKQGLQRTFGRTKKPTKQYEVLIAAIEGTLNNRPITAVTDDPNDYTTLRPVDFLRPSSNEYPESGQFLETEDLLERDYELKPTTATELRNFHNSQLIALNNFWKRWMQDYLPSLMEKNPHKKDGQLTRQPEVGELVLIEQEQSPRGSWKLGRIRKLIPSKDGVIRNAEVLLPNRKTMKRAVNQLFPLEVGGNSTDEVLDYKIKEDKEELPPKKPRRNPVRASRPKTYLYTLFILILMLGTAMAQKPLICSQHSQKSLWAMPELKYCHTNQFHDEILKREKVAIFRPNHIEYRSPGYFCKLLTSTVKQWTNVNGIEELREEPSAPEELSEEECRKMKNEKTCRHGTLTKGRNSYRTNNIVERDPPNRVSSFFGAKSTQKRNCILIDVVVFSHHGQTNAASSAADISKCEYQRGSCKPAVNEVMVWKPNATQTCDFLPLYEGDATTSDKMLLLDSWHMMLTFSKDNWTKTCNNTLKISDQGFGVQFCARSIQAQQAARRGQGQNLPPIPTPQPWAFQAPRMTPNPNYKTGLPQSTTTANLRDNSLRNLIGQSTLQTLSITPIPSTTPTQSIPSTTETYDATTTPNTTQESLRDPHKNFIKNSYLNDETRARFNITEEKLLEIGLSQEEIDELNHHIRNRPKRDEFESSDLQYLEHDLKKRIQHLAEITCRIINDHADELERLLIESPTKALRTLLKRDNLIARALSPTIVEVEFCHELKGGDYTILPNLDNCSIPIQLKTDQARPWYLDRSTHQLHRDSRLVMEEQCDKEMFVTLEGTLWKYSRVTGRLTRTHETILSNRTTEESWDFINQETILNEIPVRDAHEAGMQEEILDEIEKVAEGLAEIEKQDQTEQTTTTLQEDIIGALLDRYLKRVWYIWVSIVCGLQTYAILSAIRRHLTGNNPRFLTAAGPQMPYIVPAIQPTAPLPPPTQPPNNPTPVTATAIYHKDNESVELRTPKPRKKVWFRAATSSGEASTSISALDLQLPQNSSDEQSSTPSTPRQRTVTSLFSSP